MVLVKGKIQTLKNEAVVAVRISKLQNSRETREKEILLVIALPFTFTFLFLSLLIIHHFRARLQIPVGIPKYVTILNLILCCFARCEVIRFVHCKPWQKHNLKTKNHARNCLGLFRPHRINWNRSDRFKPALR